MPTEHGQHRMCAFCVSTADETDLCEVSNGSLTDPMLTLTLKPTLNLQTAQMSSHPKHVLTLQMKCVA